MTMRRPCALAFSLLATGFPSRPQSVPAQENHVIRIEVDLVQVDAVVTDRHGRQVTDLGPSDFKVFEDRKPRKIVAVNYIRLDKGAPAPVIEAKTKGVRQAPTPPSIRAPLRRQDVRRTLVLLVDDLNMSFESIAGLRETLKKFVVTQLLPGDLVAIQRTSGRVGSLAQFTNEKRQLLAEADGIRWLPNGIGWMAQSFPAAGSDGSPVSMFPSQNTPPYGDGQSAPAAAEELSARLRRDENGLDNLFLIGTLGALRSTIQGLRDLPGRKAVVLFSDGLTLDLDDDRWAEVRDAVRALTDLANRSAVVLYTAGTLGLPTLEPDAAARDSGGVGLDALSIASHGYLASQDGLIYLASQTGGEFIHDTNDLNHGLDRVMDDLSGYYLVSFQPDPSTFKSKSKNDDFHRIHLVLDRRGAHVRSRSGFLGIPDAAFASVPEATPGQRLLTAVESPFLSNALPARLSSYFQYTNGTPVVRNFLHVDAHSIHFTEDSGGSYDASLHVALFAFGTGGTILETFARPFSIRLTAAQFPRALAMGAVFMFDMPVSKPGAYQMRAAVLDDSTGGLGSAGQFLTIPDLKRGFALSSVVLGDPDADKLSDAAAAGASPVLRVFPPGGVMEYACDLLHPGADPQTHLTDVRTQVELYRDGKRIYASPLMTVQTNPSATSDVLSVGGKMQLAANLAPGNYILQVVAADLFARKKKLREAVAQWVDLEITAAVSTPPH